MRMLIYVPLTASLAFAALPASAIAQTPRQKVSDVVINVEVELTEAQRELLKQAQEMLDTELDFAQRVAQLTPAQRQRLADKGQEYIQKFVRERNRAPAALVAAAAGQVVVRQSAIPATMIQDRVAFLVNTELPRDVAARYMQEHANRTQFHKRTAAENVVAMIDEKLSLTAQQRDQIADALTKAWQDHEVPQLQLFAIENYFPQIPDQCIIPFLTEAQKTVWQDEKDPRRRVGAQRNLLIMEALDNQQRRVLIRVAPQAR